MPTAIMIKTACDQSTPDTRATVAMIAGATYDWRWTLWASFSSWRPDAGRPAYDDGSSRKRATVGGATTDYSAFAGRA